MNFINASPVDEAFMRRAIELAHSVDLTHDINPHVGAVIVDPAGDVVGEGWHQGSGTQHAEVMALAQAGDKARGATIYSSLEPCSSTGRMGPCTSALLDAGISRVVIGATDANPRMSGGASVLRDAGVEVVLDVCANEARELNRTWHFAVEQGRPWVTWKVATTLDGFTAAVDGTSKWITGVEARQDVQQLRSRVGAVVTGTGTVLADNPALTVRGADVQPRRVIVGTRVLPRDLQIFQDSESIGPAQQFHEDIRDVFKQLAHEGIHHVLLESGMSLAHSAWTRGLIDEVVWYQAPVLLGNGRGSLGDIGVNTIGDAIRFDFQSVDRIGADLKLTFLTNAHTNNASE